MLYHLVAFVGLLVVIVFVTDFDKAAIFEQRVAVDAGLDIGLVVAEEGTRDLVHVGDVERRERDFHEGFGQMEAELVEVGTGLAQFGAQANGFFREFGRARCSVFLNHGSPSHAGVPRR